MKFAASNGVGWDVIHLYRLPQDGHIVPVNDYRPHALARTCWCHPLRDIIDLGLWVHNSLDQREHYERGILKVH